MRSLTAGVANRLDCRTARNRRIEKAVESPQNRSSWPEATLAYEEHGRERPEEEPKTIGLSRG
ncbi:hypothetical protein [Candidatus Methylomirabilis sp.]|uniref:Uncharacterized protein n=1 Tax=Candidatus Methylomirabilis tolerans TaxID=3123416 RepID=A0AAJ1AGW8_9BACT|nr:hypothetical protein [Candidatus Methylomirabilis sp.]